MRRLLFLAFPLLLLSADRRVSEREGSIYGIVGVWTKDGKPLRFGNAVNVGDRVCVQKTGMLLVSFKDGTASYTCDREGCAEKPPCGRPVSEEDKKLVSGLDKIYAAILPFIRRDGDRLISAVSRGTDVTEAVVALHGTQLDLTPMLNDLAPGEYNARFTPVAPNAGQPFVAPVKHSPGSPALVSAAGVHAGVYDVEILDLQQAKLGVEAWILASGPDKFARDTAAFKQASEVTSAWSSSVDSRSVRAVLRAYLESLAWHD